MQQYQKVTMPHKKIGAIVCASLALLSLAGCGGGGGGSAAGTTASSGLSAMNVYVTDGFSDQYKQVLVTLYKIEVTADGTTYQTVFSSTAGQTLDLSSLSATAELLASVSVPSGSYTQARITFGDHVTLVAADGTSTSVAVDPSVGTQANGQVALMVAAPTHAVSGQTSTLLVDFKLAEFQLVGSVLRPSIGCGSDGQIGGKQRMGHLIGTVTALTSTGFTLQGPDGKTVAVTLTSTTTLDGGASGTTLTLANGQNVIVDGAFDPTTQTVTATSVMLADTAHAQRQQARDEDEDRQHPGEYRAIDEEPGYVHGRRPVDISVKRRRWRWLSGPAPARRGGRAAGRRRRCAPRAAAPS